MVRSTSSFSRQLHRGYFRGSCHACSGTTNDENASRGAGLGGADCQSALHATSYFRSSQHVPWDTTKDENIEERSTPCVQSTRAERSHTRVVYARVLTPQVGYFRGRWLGDGRCVRGGRCAGLKPPRSKSKAPSGLHPRPQGEPVGLCSFRPAASAPALCRRAVLSSSVERSHVGVLTPQVGYFRGSCHACPAHRER